MDWLWLVMCQEYGDPHVERHKVREVLTQKLADAYAPDGNPDADPETWGNDPEAVAAQEAMMRRAAMVGDDTAPEHAPEDDAAHDDDDAARPGGDS